jgi:hypothetical protein
MESLKIFIIGYIMKPSHHLFTIMIAIVRRVARLQVRQPRREFQPGVESAHHGPSFSQDLHLFEGILKGVLENQSGIGGRRIPATATPNHEEEKGAF